jgi:hypothetical protein
MRITDLTRGTDPVNVSYWVKKFTMSRSGSSCSMGVQILSAINMPPYVPPDIVGMGMSCSYPLSALPKEVIKKEDCEGELVEYFWKV